jgi:hypothetical protein
MARPLLTLHQGDQRATYAEHPTAAARRALIEAADCERDPEWSSLFLRFASSLPDRAPLRKGEDH